MGLLRLILLLVAGWLIWHMVRAWLHGKQTGTTRRSALPTRKMVRCEYCGVHLPITEAAQRDGHFYCDAKHLEAARRRDQPR